MNANNRKGVACISAGRAENRRTGTQQGLPSFATIRVHRRINAFCLLAALVLASSCGTAPKKAQAPSGGKYYLDDGPPESIPDNLASIPDAVPRSLPGCLFTTGT